VPESLGADDAPARDRSVHTVELDGEAVLLDERENRLHHLNQAATLVWACLDGRAPLHEVASDIAAGLGLDPAVVLGDTVAIARQLGRQGLLAGLAGVPDGER
jgi:hypothetical protein